MSTSPEGAAAVDLPISVAVLDPRRLVRECLEALLADSDGVAVCLEPTEADVVVVAHSSDPLPHLRRSARTIALSDVAGLGELLEWIRTAGGSPRQARTARRRPMLTPREREVLGAVSLGLSAKQIAGRLGISARTVELHTRSAVARLGVANQAGAVARFHELGLAGGVGTATSISG